MKRRRNWTVVAVFAAALGGARLARAQQPGVIAFRDDCNGLLYAMRGDGSGRIALPMPPRPLPTDRYVQPMVLDVSTSGGPATVVYYTGIGRIEVVNGQNHLTILDYGHFAVELNEVNGALAADPPEPERLHLDQTAGLDPDQARFGSISPSGDRLALVVRDETTAFLMTAEVDHQDLLHPAKITGLSDLVVVGDLYSMGTPDPTSPATQGFTGYVDFTPNGASIVASIYYDLWRIDLNLDHTFLDSAKLTQNSDGLAEWNPAVSPDGTRVAYTAGPITGSGGVSSRAADIYSLNLASHATTQVTNNRNRGKASEARNNAMWSRDGTRIGFSAYSSSPRHWSCASINSDIFVIAADGSSTATPLTNLDITSAEVWPRWGW